jgi:hypothetical protein
MILAIHIQGSDRHWVGQIAMSEEIEITHEGKTTRGKYYVWTDHDGYPLVTVISDDGRAKTTHVGGSPLEGSAQRLLIELAKDHAVR